VQVFNEGLISGREDLSDKRLSHFLVNSASNSGNSDIVRPRLTPSKQKDPLEFTSKILERDTALTEPVKLLVSLFNELAIFELGAEVSVECVKGLIVDSTGIGGVNSHPRKNFCSSISLQSAIGVPYLGVYVPYSQSIDVDFGLELSEEGKEQGFVRVVIFRSVP
jgi:hypothetical protein